MRLFKVVSKFVAFDEDESMVVLARSPEKALSLAKNSWKFRDGKEKEKIEYTIEEIKLDTERIIEVAHYGD